MERDCNKCIWATRDGGCAAWECEFVAKSDAYKAYKSSRWIPYNGETLPSGNYLVTLVRNHHVTLVGHAHGEWIGCARDNVLAYMPQIAPYNECDSH